MEENTQQQFEFPNIWIGYVFAGFYLVASTIFPLLDFGEAAVTIILACTVIVGIIYWLVSVGDLHDVVQKATGGQYPVSAASAFWLHVVPGYGIYWVMRWPGELKLFIDTISGKKDTRPWSLGIFFIGAGLIGLINGSLGLAGMFFVLGLLTEELKHALQNAELPVKQYTSAYTLPRPQAALGFCLAIAWLIVFAVLFGRRVMAPQSVPKEEVVTETPKPAAVPAPPEKPARPEEPDRQGLEKQLAGLNVAIEKNPDDALSYFKRGMAFGMMTEHEKALQDFTRALELDKDFNNTDFFFYNRGLSYSFIGQQEKAVADFSRTIELNPKADLAYYNRGLAKARRGKYDEAMQDFSKTIELEPKADFAYCDRGVLYSVKGQYEQALQDFDTAIGLNSRSYVAYYNRGLAYAHLERPEKAVEDFTRAIELQPSHGLLYYDRAVSYQHIGKYEASIKDFTRTIELLPSNAEAFHGRALSHFLNKDFDKSWEDVRSVRELGGTVNGKFLEALTKETGRSE